ncbi:hypothetical protein Tco_0359181 [Tanacetum coccineum]
MASLDHRLNPLFSIKECSSCGALYTADFCCSKGGLEDKILVPKPPQNCATCGDPVDGLYCRSCAFVRKCLNEGWYTIHDENEILNTFESSNDNTNIVSAPQEPISCENGALYGYNCPSKARIISIRKTMAIKPLMSSHNFNKFFDPTLTSDNESECDMPVCDDFTTFSNPLFDLNDDFTSSDDELLSDEDVPKENFKIYSNPLFDDEEIISPKIDPHYFNAESNLIESLLNRDILIDSSPKFDYLLEEFFGELARIDPIPPGIEKADFDLEEEIHLVENLLNDSPPLPKNELSNLDHFNDPSPPRPPPEPPNVEVFFDFEPDTGVVTTKVVKGISEHYVLMPNILPTLPTFDPDLDFTLSHDSLRFGNKIFDPGIFIEVQSERLLSRDEFSISFIRDPLSPVIYIFASFSSEKHRDKVFNPGILISLLLSH